MVGSSLGAGPTVQSAAKAGAARSRRATRASRRIADHLGPEHGHIVALPAMTAPACQSARGRGAVAVPLLAIRPADSTRSANPVSVVLALTASGCGTKAGFIALNSKAETKVPGVTRSRRS